MSEFQACFDALLTEHGITSTADQHIARALAYVMTDTSADPVRAAEAISKLTTLLPPKSEAPPTTIDLSALSDEDLAELERIISKAPTATPKPELAQALELIERINSENARLRQERDYHRDDAEHFRPNFRECRTILLHVLRWPPMRPTLSPCRVRWRAK